MGFIWLSCIALTVFGLWDSQGAKSASKGTNSHATSHFERGEELEGLRVVFQLPNDEKLQESMDVFSQAQELLESELQGFRLKHSLSLQGLEHCEVISEVEEVSADIVIFISINHIGSSYACLRDENSNLLVGVLSLTPQEIQLSTQTELLETIVGEIEGMIRGTRRKLVAQCQNDINCDQNNDGCPGDDQACIVCTNNHGPVFDDNCQLCLTSDGVGCTACPSGIQTCCPVSRFFDTNAGSCVDCATSDAVGCLTCPNTTFDCCPNDKNDNDQDGVCKCDNGNTEYSNCLCPQNYQFQNSLCTGPITDLTATISGPLTINNACSPNTVTFSVPGFETILDAVYTWSSSTTPALNTLVQGETTNTVTLDGTGLPAGAHTIDVGVSALGVEYSGSLTFLVFTNTVLAISLSPPSPISITTADTQIVTVSVTANPCENSSITYDWQPSTPARRVRRLVPTSSEPSLTINPGDLAAGTYDYTVTVSSGGLTTTETFTIVVTDPPSQPLVAVIDPVDTIINRDDDLVLNGSNSQDPNNFPEDFTYLWTCSATVATDCPSFTTNNMSTLTIPKENLVNGSTFTITLEVSKQTLSDTESVTFTVNPCTSSSVMRINPNGKVVLSVNGSISSISWSVTMNSDLPGDRLLRGNGGFRGGRWRPWYPGHTWERIENPKFVYYSSLTPGNCYVYTATYTTSSGTTETQDFPVYANIPPTCSNSLSTSPFTIDTAAATDNIVVDNCTDPDGTDAPLLYTIKVQRPGYYYWWNAPALVEDSTDNTANYSFVIGQSYRISAEVTDEDGATTYYEIWYTRESRLLKGQSEEEGETYYAFYGIGAAFVAIGAAIIIKRRKQNSDAERV